MKTVMGNNFDEEEDEYLLSCLHSDDPEERYQSIRKIRNCLIGMKSKKSKFVSLGLIDILLELMVREDATVELGVEGAAILGSIARGHPDDFKILLSSQAIAVLCKGICHGNERLAMACLRSLRVCFTLNQVPLDLIFVDETLVSKLVQMLYKSANVAEEAANILRRSCKTVLEQNILCEMGIIPALLGWLTSKQKAIVVPVLGCLSVLVSGNEIIANKLLEVENNLFDVKGRLTKLISRDQDEEIQLEAAACLTLILRAAHAHQDITDTMLERKLLHSFVNMCHPDKCNRLKMKAAVGLAYLIEEDSELQSVAAISDHLIKNIGLYFKLEAGNDVSIVDELREGAFKVFACLSANDEKIRKQIVDVTPKLTTYVHDAVNQDLNISLQTAALQCLLSLSRSVQQLRTTFQDVKLWEPVITALKSSSSDDVISVASSVLCNLLLHFSPCKEALVEYGALDVLIRLINRTELPFRVNGVWGLLNLAYDADDTLKKKIVEVVGMRNILKLLEDDDDIAVKALGILRNLLTEKEQNIDTVMQSYGTEIMRSIKPLVINCELSEKLHEQVLCLLSKIANCETSKGFLMQDEELLYVVIECLTSPSEQLQVASVFCITNLMKGSDDLGNKRLFKLKKLGADKQLRASQETVNSNLHERIKVELEKFS